MAAAAAAGAVEKEIIVVRIRKTKEKPPAHWTTTVPANKRPRLAPPEKEKNDKEKDRLLQDNYNLRTIQSELLEDRKQLVLDNEKQRSQIARLQDSLEHQVRETNRLTGYLQYCQREIRSERNLSSQLRELLRDRDLDIRLLKDDLDDARRSQALSTSVMLQCYGFKPR